MKKNNEEKILKIYFIISVIVLIVVILFIYGNKILCIAKEYVDREKTVSENKNNHYDETIIETNIISENFIKSMEEKFTVILPPEVSSKQINIEKKLLEKKVIISYCLHDYEFDLSNVKNYSSYVGNIEYNIEKNNIYITVNFNSVVDMESCIEDSVLYFGLFKPRNIYDKIVVIDPGHGGNDVGAINNGIYEKNIDLDVCKKLNDLFDKEDIKVYFTRMDDSLPSVEERVDFVNELMPDLFISIHSNWYEDKGVNGTSVLYNYKDNSEFNSKWLSAILATEVSGAGGLYNKGIVEGNEIHIVRHSNVPVALVELGFMSNENDFKVLYSSLGQEQLAKGIYTGIVKAINSMK